APPADCRAVPAPRSRRRVRPTPRGGPDVRARARRRWSAREGAATRGGCTASEISVQEWWIVMPSVYDRFNLVSDFELAGDQAHAIGELVEGLERGDTHQVLLGVTGSGKTFTMAQTVARVNRPTLVMVHNKTLAAQLYQEFRRFFPDNAVEYFV